MTRLGLGATAPAPAAPPPAPPPPPVAPVCELSPALQARVDQLHGTLATTTHHEILGLSPGADRAAIKAAYFAFVATLHPDRHFRKQLGPYKAKLEAIFVRLTTAYEALSTAARAQSLKLAARAPAPAAEPPRPLVSVAPPAEGSKPGGARARIRIATGQTAKVFMPVKVSEEAAERLSASMRPGSPEPRGLASAPPRDAPSDADAEKGMRRLLAGKAEQDARERARLFTEAAEYELAKGNVIAAATQFQFALSCCDSPEVRAVLEAVTVMANERRFEVQLTRAEAAERAADWAVAADGYGRAHAVRPEPRIAERLANALRLSKGDLRQAGKLLEEAVMGDPDNVGFRCTLAEVYADAGLDLRAEAEARKALALAPTHPRAMELAAKLTKTDKRR